MSGSHSQNRFEAPSYNVAAEPEPESTGLHLSVSDVLVVNVGSSRDSDAGHGVPGSSMARSESELQPDDSVPLRTFVHSRTFGGFGISRNVNEWLTEQGGDSGRDNDDDDVEMFEAGVEDRVATTEGPSNPSTSGRPAEGEEDDEDAEDEEEDEEEEDGSPDARPRRRSNRLAAASGTGPVGSELPLIAGRGAKAARLKFPRPPSTVVIADPVGELNADDLLPTCPSRVRAEDIPEWRRKWEIPDSVEIMIPDPGHAFYNPPAGYMCMHEVTFACGWKIPIAPELKGILNRIGVGPSQVIPKSLGNLICFAVFCKKKGQAINFENFRQLFYVAFSQGNQLFYTFLNRKNYNFISDSISSIGSKWWDRYVFVRMALKPGESEEQREKWELPTKFSRDCIPDGRPLAKNVSPWVAAIHKKHDPPIYPFYGLICQPLPYLCGLTGEVEVGGKTDFSKGSVNPACLRFLCRSLFKCWCTCADY